MSVWAQAWAYEQRAGSGGAKSVLVALAVFADEEGYCYPSQERIAGMTEQGVRTVRLHLASLEKAGLISRKRRRRPDGTYSSDGFHLLAPSERLRPHIPAPDENLRQILPAADIAVGKNQQDQRQIPAQPAAKNSSNQRQILPGNSQGINRQVNRQNEPSSLVNLDRGKASLPALARFSPAICALSESQYAFASDLGYGPEDADWLTAQWADRRRSKGITSDDWEADHRAFLRGWSGPVRGAPIGSGSHFVTREEQVVKNNAKNSAEFLGYFNGSSDDGSERVQRPDEPARRRLPH